MKNIWWDTI